MLRITGFLSGVIITLLPSATAEELPRRDWIRSWQEGEEIARREQLPRVIHFHATWCGPCQTMEQTVLSHPATLEVLRSGVIGVKLDSDLVPDIVARFRIVTLPTDLFLDSRGQEIARTEGVQELSQYLKRLTELRVNSTVARANTRPIPPLDRFHKAEHRPPPEGTTDIGNSVVLTDDKDGYRLGLAGYSVVALAQRRVWLPGQEDFSVIHKGVRYRFADEAEFQAFQARPEAYVPCLHGFDPVAFRDFQVLSLGRLRLSLRHQERLYFFATEVNRDAFQRDPGRYRDVEVIQLFRRESTTIVSTP